MTFIKNNIASFIIIIFHLVGFIGFQINPSYFKALSPVNLLLSTFLVLYTSYPLSWKTYLVLIIIGAIGFFVEVVGVKTGLIFGSYHYGRALGFSLVSVPLLMGVNWAMLIFACGNFIQSNNKLLKAFVVASLMVLLDVFMESNAPKFDFWYWQNGIIPLQNFAAWFIISFLIQLLFNAYLIQKKSSTTRIFYITQLVFFIALYLF